MSISTANRVLAGQPANRLECPKGGGGEYEVVPNEFRYPFSGIVREYESQKKTTKKPTFFIFSNSMFFSSFVLLKEREMLCAQPLSLSLDDVNYAS
jgi:hypothetical protein